MQKDVLESSALKLTSRERRSIKFASVEHKGQLYMTTQDFIESITEAEPRREWGRGRCRVQVVFFLTARRLVRVVVADKAGTGDGRELAKGGLSAE